MRRLRKLKAATDVSERIAEIMEFAGQDVLDLSRSRVVEQEVLDCLDEVRPDL